MLKQILFALALAVTLGVFAYTALRYIKFFRLTKKDFPVRDFGKRFGVMMEVAFGQTKIFRRPVVGLFHALTFWGFCLILFGSIEMVIDGLSGSEKALKFFGPVYSFIMASGDIFAVIVAISILIFLFRRVFLHVRRFQGIEMKHISHLDANIALSMILLLMISLLGMNITYVSMVSTNGHEIAGVYPFSNIIAPLLSGLQPDTVHVLFEISWWSHILLIFIFANMLPYSKHFHVFMSVPNVFLTRLYPLGHLPNMDNITREVKMMMNPDTAFAAAPADGPMERFGVKDAEDSTWKQYLDSLSCTECGRCTAACPANITGKKLSPRKIVMDLRARMKEKGPYLVKDRNYDDQKALIRSYITEEELWACTMCNACAKECPININHPPIIADMRRYLVMEEGSAPGQLKVMFNNIENNGAPWQYSAEDRLLWAKDLEIKIN
jgi:heterodisulfide reductase subunit C/nitrate reductase gamma subunit